MKVIQSGNLQEAQPAIDTCCDHCGAIYDLADCYIATFGNILCPDCNVEGFGKNDLFPMTEMSNGYEIMSMNYNADSFYIKQHEWYEKFLSLPIMHKLNKLLKIYLPVFFRKKHPLVK